jgi:hypothetical protein
MRHDRLVLLAKAGTRQHAGDDDRVRVNASVTGVQVIRVMSCLVGRCQQTGSGQPSKLGCQHCVAEPTGSQVMGRGPTSGSGEPPSDAWPYWRR